MFQDNKVWLGTSGDEKVYVYPKMANRHGMIAGATGTGKTVTLKVLAESFSSCGVPVFLADVKGDLAAMCRPGEENEKVRERMDAMKLEEYGFDFIKVDWCGGQKLDLDEKEQYTKIANIIEKIRERTQRCIVFNICRWQFPGEWATKIADSWRTGADIRPEFESILYQLDNIRSLARFASCQYTKDNLE